VERLPNALDDTARQDLLKRTLGTQRVGERLNRGRCLPIGISSRGEEAKGERQAYLVVAYDYSAVGRGQADGAAGRGYRRLPEFVESTVTLFQPAALAAALIPGRCSRHPSASVATWPSLSYRHLLLTSDLSARV